MTASTREDPDLLAACSNGDEHALGALYESHRPAQPRLRSHLEAVAASHSTYGTIAANVAFVVSRSTASLHPDGYETGFSAERAWQLDRLLDPVGLH